MNLFSRASTFLISHSQIITTRQPSSDSSFLTRPSRATFLLILPIQYSRLALGVRAPRAQSWPCQKQPCTKMTVPQRGKTTSGFPGNPHPPRRKRSPLRWSMLRILSSGRVSDPFTARMTRLRSAVVSKGPNLDFEAWVSFYLFNEGPLCHTKLVFLRESMAQPPEGRTSTKASILAPNSRLLWRGIILMRPACFLKKITYILIYRAFTKQTQS